MRVHVFTTDATVLGADLPSYGMNVVAVIVPENRNATEKVAGVRARAPAPVFVQKRGADLNDTLPTADAAIVWLYSQIFPPSLISRYPRGMLNMHGGKIPEYRGASVLHWALINGEPTLGITWHQIVKEVDAGPIWSETELPIRDADTAWSLRTRMIDTALEMLPGAWNAMVNGGQPKRIPDLGGGKVWPQRRDRDGLIRPGMAERDLRNLVRALCPPWPAATILTDRGPRRVLGISVSAPPAKSIKYVTAEGRELFLHLAQD